METASVDSAGLLTMDSHPSYEALSVLIKKYPAAAAGLFQAYNDVVYAQEWADISVIDLGEGFNRGAIQGRRKKGLEDGGGFHDSFSYVMAYGLLEKLSFNILRGVFKRIGAKEVYLAIASEDASIVYYRLSDGIVKPPV